MKFVAVAAAVLGQGLGFFTTPAAHAADYYVSLAGNAANSGTSADPIPLAEAVLRANATAGADTIHLGNETYPITSTLTFTAPVTITGSSSSVLDCSGMGASICVIFRPGTSAASGIENIAIQDAPAAAVKVESALMEITDVSFSGNGTAVLVNHALADVLVDGCSFDSDDKGVHLGRANQAVIRSSTFDSMVVQGVLINGMANPQISESTFTGSAIGVSVSGITGVPMIERNRFEGGTTALQFVGAGTVNVRNNVIHDTTGAAVTSNNSNVQFHYNTVAQAGGNGFTATSADASDVHNNVFYASTGYGVSGDATSTGLTIGNNSFYSNSVGAYSISGTDSGGHLTSDPDFVDAATDDFSLSNTSPLIDAANSSLAAVTVDHVGESRVNAKFGGSSPFDVGAYEVRPIIRLYVTGNPTGGLKDYDYQEVSSMVSADGRDFHIELGYRMPTLACMTDADIFQDSSGTWVMLFSKALESSGRGSGSCSFTTASPPVPNSTLYRATSSTPNGTFVTDSYSVTGSGNISSTLEDPASSTFYTYTTSSGSIDVSTYTSAGLSSTTSLGLGTSNAYDPSMVYLPLSSQYILFYKEEGSPAQIHKAVSSSPTSGFTIDTTPVVEGRVPGAVVVDDTIYLYYSTPSSGSIQMIKSEDGGSTWTSPYSIAVAPPGAADPHPVPYE